MQYKVYECEGRITPNGKALKKLVLQGDGKQYPDKNVTMWSDHPLFNTVAAGQTIDVDLDIQDSKTPNPKGGFYKNKTVINPNGRAPRQTPAAPQVQKDGSRAENLIEFKVLPLLTRIESELRRLNGANPDAIDKAFAGEPTNESMDEDNIPGPEDLPF